MQVTGKLTAKRYRCQSCGHEKTAATNHYGEFYDICSNCSSKSPTDPIKVHECLEPLPAGWEKPEPWKKVKLGDIIAGDQVAESVIRQALDDAAAQMED
jgi:hypothetical protein